MRPHPYVPNTTRTLFGLEETCAACNREESVGNHDPDAYPITPMEMYAFSHEGESVAG